ncbi:hypothetical protein Tco_0701007 [Tanacetum coccineum]
MWLIYYMDALEINIDRSAFHESECLMKKQEVHAIKENEKWLNESNMQTQEGMVNEARADKVVSEVENAAVRPSYDNDTLTETAQTFHMLPLKEDIFNMGKRALYNIDEMGKDMPSNHMMIFEEELKCEVVRINVFLT